MTTMHRRQAIRALESAHVRNAKASRKSGGGIIIALVVALLLALAYATDTHIAIAHIIGDK